MHNAITRIPLLALLGVVISNGNAFAEGNTEDLDHSTAEITDDASAAVWPLAMRDRPLTLVRGMFSAGASVDMASTFENIRLGLGGLSGLSYGISDAFTVGVSYELGLTPSEGKGPIGIQAGYTFYAEGALILTATTSFTRDLLAESNAMGLGVMYWYNLGDKLSIFGGGDQIGAGLDPNVAAMSLPVALGYQLNANAFFAIDTSAGDLVITDETEMLASSFLGRDVLPLGFTGTYSPTNSLDLFASLGTDLLNSPSDALSVGIGAIYYGGAK